ncbi:MAG TPA: hypothetical protein VLL75_02365, partial [Vicinamibacteria bacterium]|nr:hypothetical protein [Vicinamibacteria bacterium]
MLELAVASAIGVVAAGLAWPIAHRIGPAGSRRHRVALFVFFVALFSVGNAALMPHARAWKQERDVEALLAGEPLFAAVLADEPGLREPLRAALRNAFRGGQAGEAVQVGQRLLSPRLWRYVPRASDAAALRLGQALVSTLEGLQARDPEQCYRFLFPAVAGPPRAGAADRDDRLLSALRAVVASARDGSAEPLDRKAAAKQLEAVFDHLRDEHGSDIDVLKNAQA